MKKLIIAILIIILLSVAGFFGYKEMKKRHASAMPKHDLTQEVNVIKIKLTKISPVTTFPARVSAYKIADVRPQVSGAIVKRLFKEGAMVRKGDQLYTIDDTAYKAAYLSAKESANSAEAKYKRYQILQKSGAVSKQEFDDAKSAFEQAKSALAQAKQNLGYTKVYAEIGGYIGRSNFTEGYVASALQASPLATIAQISPIYADAMLPLEEAKKLGDVKKMQAVIQPDGEPMPLTGVVEFAEVVVEASTNSLALRAVFQNSGGKLLPGAYVNLGLVSPPFEAILVPQRSALRSVDGTLSVWVAEGEKITVRPVKASRTYKNFWVIDEGLKVDDLVVFEGFQKINRAAKVKAVIMEEKSE